MGGELAAPPSSSVPDAAAATGEAFAKEEEKHVEAEEDEGKVPHEKS